MLLSLKKGIVSESLENNPCSFSILISKQTSLDSDSILTSTGRGLIGLYNKIYFETSNDPKGLLSMTLIKMIAFCPEEKKNFKLGNLNSIKDDSLFDWDIVLRKIDLSTLLNQVLSFSSAKKDKKNLIISLPKEKIERINDEYKKEIASSLNIYFNEILEISYDSNVDLNKTPAFIKEKLELKNSSEAVEMISNDEGFKKISSEFKTDIKNISKK